MALNPVWVQDLLAYKDTLAPPDFIPGSDSGAIGRTHIDGVLVVYDIEDPPAWLATIFQLQDEDGNTAASGMLDVLPLRAPREGEYVEPTPDLVPMDYDEVFGDAAPQASAS